MERGSSKRRKRYGRGVKGCGEMFSLKWVVCLVGEASITVPILPKNHWLVSLPVSLLISLMEGDNCRSFFRTSLEKEEDRRVRFPVFEYWVRGLVDRASTHTQVCMYVSSMEVYCKNSAGEDRKELVDHWHGRRNVPSLVDLVSPLMTETTLNVRGQTVLRVVLDNEENVILWWIEVQMKNSDQSRDDRKPRHWGRDSSQSSLP